MHFFLFGKSPAPENFAEANVGKENVTFVDVEAPSRLRRDSVLFVSPALFFHLLSTRGFFTVKQTLIARTVTPQRDNVNYEQFRKSKYNRGAAG